MKIKKTVSIILALVLILSLSVPAFAEGKSYKPYQFYMNIGDSIARGCGLEFPTDPDQPLYYDDTWTNFNGGHNLPGSFPAEVANAIDPSKTEADGNLQYMGMRTVEALSALGGDIDPWSVDNFCSDDFGYHFRGDGGIDTLREEFMANTAKADLITLQVGSNDVFYGPQSMSGLTSFGGDDMLQKAEDYLGYMWEGYERFLELYPLIVERIFELQAEAGHTAKDFDLVLVGLYPSLSNAPLTDEILLPVGEALTIVTDLVNSFIKSIADKYDNVYYADISGTETPVTSGSISLIGSFTVGNPTVNVHPTVEGYKYIARQVLNALPQRKVLPKTYIALGLPTDLRVTSVLLGTAKASFTQEGYELVVPNLLTTRKSMTVYGTAPDGRSVIYVYNLDYSRTEGYTATRITGTSDLSLSVGRVITAAKGVITTVAGLFKK